MKGIVFFYAIIAAICFYFTLQLLFGAYGVTTIAQTRQYAETLTIHIGELHNIQERLKEDVVALQIDPQRIEEEARRIGYYDPRDIVIRHADRMPIEQGNDFGRHLYSPSDIRGDSRALFRWLSFSFGLLCLIFFSLLDGAHDNRDDEDIRDGEE